MRVGDSAVPTGDIEFVLLPHQLRFGGLVYGGVRHPAIIGGAGLGKTKLLVTAAITLCSINVGLPMVLTEPTYAMVVDILEPMVRETCETELLLDADGNVVFDESGSPVSVPRARPIPYRYRARSHVFEFPWWGSSILCRSGDKPRRLRGPNIAAAGMDEVGDQSEEVFTTLQGRVRHAGAKLRCLMVAGTPRGFNWAYQRWVEPAGSKRLRNAAFLGAAATENEFIMRADPEWEASMRATYDPELYRQEVLGEFVAIGQHSTYHAFSRAGNVAAGLQVDPIEPLIVMCGFNRSPMAWVVGQYLPRRRVLQVLGELAEGQRTSEEACAEVQRRWGRAVRPIQEIREPVTVYQVYGDASGYQPAVKKNYSDYEIIRDELRTSPRVNRKNPLLRDRVNALNALLTNAAGEHRVVIDGAHCPMLIRDLEQTRFIPGTFDIDGSNPDLTHWAHALSLYAAMAHPVVAGRRR